MVKSSEIKFKPWKIGSKKYTPLKLRLHYGLSRNSMTTLTAATK